MAKKNFVLSNAESEWKPVAAELERLEEELRLAEEKVPGPQVALDAARTAHALAQQALDQVRCGTAWEGA